MCQTQMGCFTGFYDKHVLKEDAEDLVTQATSKQTEKDFPSFVMDYERKKRRHNNICSLIKVLHYCIANL